ncbi:hypothetical protein, partial [Moorena sp. SIO2C4]|uniref:hypothetical protein n=1 Tax=Moorena sp. SIO2C4 TaxID=2607824 RepID=UPI00257BF71B
FPKERKHSANALRARLALAVGHATRMATLLEVRTAISVSRISSWVMHILIDEESILNKRGKHLFNLS